MSEGDRAGRTHCDDASLKRSLSSQAKLFKAVPLSTGSVNSLARFGLLAFPLMWPLADWVNETPRRRTLCVAAALVLTALLVAELRINSP